MKPFKLFFRSAFTFFAALILVAPQALAQANGLTSRPVVAPYLDGVLPPQAPVLSGNWSAVLAFPNLTFLNPVGLTPLPGTSKLVVWEREGRVYSFENQSTVSAKTLLIDVSAQCQGWDDSGLLGLAFHPNFAVNRHVYLWYNWRATVAGNANTRPPVFQPGGRNRLSRFTLDANGVALPNSEFVIIDQEEESVWHNGGGMFFHPTNGFLYITNGDDAVDSNTQTISGKLMSGVLRIDVDLRGGSISHVPPRRATGEISPNWPAHYIPNDNPFVGVPDAREEFFAIGLRSPHRMTIDPLTLRIFIGDVGGGAKEEITVIEPNDPPGLNLQWSRIEGLDGDLTGNYIGVSKRPVIDYTHSEGGAIIGGYVYRGQQFAAELGGKYIFGDNIANVIWVLDESVTPATKTLLATFPRGPGPNSGNDYIGLSSFGLDAAGELYMCQMSSTAGRIYKLERGGVASQPLPAKLSDVGAFSDLPTLTPSTKLIPYTLNAPFFSDYAIKQRWAVVPSDTTVGFAPTGEWTFPTGSVFVKHFDLATSDLDPLARKRLETRLLVKMASGAVYGATYKWRADNSEADLLEGSLTENVPIEIAPLGALVGADIGNPALSGSTSRTNDAVTIQAGGTDIYGTSDQFHFAHQQRTGDFDIHVRAESVSESDLYTKAGLMARATLDADSPNVMALVFPSNAARNNNIGGFEFQYRTTAGGGSTALYPPLPQARVNYPNTWLRLQRTEDTFIAYWSVDGVVWQEYSRTTLALPDTVFFGLAVTAHTGGARTTAKFHLQSTRMQAWYYPSRQDCVTCHTQNSTGVLGLKTRQLNRDYTYPNGVIDNQIRAWKNINLFSNPPVENEIPTFDKLAHQTNLAEPLEKRARSYIDTNCASCHRPGGVQAFWDARFDTPLSSQGILYGRVGNTLGIPDAKVVVPQNLSKSIMHHRVNTTGPNKMAPVGRNSIDREGLALLADWINSLAPNTPPAVALTAPANNTIVTRGSSVLLQATASDTDGITKVEFFRGIQKMGEDSSAPYEFNWIDLPRGSFVLTAVAHDGIGNSATSSEVLVTVRNAPGAPDDFFGEYFNNQNLTSPVLTRFDQGIDFNWGNGAPDPSIGVDTFSVRWTGPATPAYSEAYTFYTLSDDGIRLWVNNQLLIDRWVDQPPTEVASTPIQLIAGQSYDIRVEYFENGGGAQARLFWSSASQQRSVINGPPPPPAMPDTFANAVLLAGNYPTTSGTNTFATAQTGEPIHFNGGKSVWAKWIAPHSGTAVLSTAGSTFDTTLAVYTGSAVNALTLAALVNDDFEGRTSRVTFAVTSGVTYRIGVDGWEKSTGNVNLSVTLPPLVQPLATDSDVAETPINPGTVRFRLSAAPPTAVTVNFSVTGTATAGVDYTTSPGLTGSTGAVTIAANTTDGLVQINPRDDTNYAEMNETVIVTATANAGYTVGSPAAASVTIRDNTPYTSAWVTRFPAIRGANNASGVDIESDGATNFLEFSFDMNPFAVEPALWPVSAMGEFADPNDNGIIKSFATISFLKRTDAPGLTYVPEMTTDLLSGEWTDDMVLVSTVAGPTAATERVTYRSARPASGPGALTSAFIRVRIATP